MEQAAREEDELVLSQLSLRKGLGILGLMLPVIFLLVSALSPKISLQRSLSAFYYVPYLCNLLVGVLCAIGAFLVFYRGYRKVPRAFQNLPVGISRHMTDAKLTTLAGLGAIVTALLPTCAPTGPCGSLLMAGLHLAGSVTFLGTLAVMSIWSFTESDTPRQDWDADKIWSNRVYITCGWIILAALVAAGLVLWLKISAIGPLIQPVFWLESLAIGAFGMSWLVKGDAISGMIGLLHRARSG